MLIKLIKPEDLHKKAQEVKPVKQKPVEEVPLWQTVVGIINDSSGHSRTSAPICGVQTTEYVVIPVSASMLDEDAVRVKVELEQAGFYCEFVADAIKRFNEESLIVVCWDPAVIAVSNKDEYKNKTDIARGLCILPGREGQMCNGCYDCHVYYQSSLRK